MNIWICMKTRFRDMHVHVTKPLKIPNFFDPKYKCHKRHSYSGIFLSYIYLPNLSVFKLYGALSNQCKTFVSLPDQRFEPFTYVVYMFITNRRPLPTTYAATLPNPLLRVFQPFAMWAYSGEWKHSPVCFVWKRICNFVFWPFKWWLCLFWDFKFSCWMEFNMDIEKNVLKDKCWQFGRKSQIRPFPIPQTKYQW